MTTARRAALGLAPAALDLLNACAAPEPRRVHSLKPADATLILRSIDMPVYVDFSLRSGPSAQPCDGFEKVGTVRDGGGGKLLPWIAELGQWWNRAPGELQTSVPAGQRLDIKGYGAWYGPTTRGSCGPLVAAFVPASSHTYRVEFVWAGLSACSIRVSDTTHPSGVSDMPVHTYGCPSPPFGP
jgi:hypothetical protein